MLIHSLFSLAPPRHHEGLLMFWILWAPGLLLAGPPAGDIQPMYEGQPLSHWVEVLGGPSVSSKWIPEIMEIEGGLEAQEALEHIGINAIPFLIRWIGGEALPAAGISNVKPLQPIFPASHQEGTDLGWRFARAKGAMQAFRVLGPLAFSAIPELARLVTSQFGAGEHPFAIDQGVVQPPCAQFVLPALGAIGPDSLSFILTIVTNKTYTSATRATALEAVEAMGTNALLALPVVLQCAEDSQEFVALAALESLNAFGQHDQRVFVALTNALHHPAQGVRFRAMAALKPYGAQALPALLYAFNDTSYGVRYNALTTLVRIAPEALTNASVLAIAAQSLRTNDSDAKLWAAQVLQAAGQQSRGKKPSVELSGRDLGRLWLEATNTLRQLAPELVGRPLPAGPSL